MNANDWDPWRERFNAKAGPLPHWGKAAKDRGLRLAQIAEMQWQVEHVARPQRRARGNRKALKRQFRRADSRLSFKEWLRLRESRGSR